VDFKSEDISAAISAVKGVIDVVRDLKSLSQKRLAPPSEVERLDLGKLEEFQEKLINFRIAYAHLQEENIRLKQESRDLEAKLEKKQQGVVDDHAAWRILASGQRQGPYCPNCFELNGNFIMPNRGILTGGMVVYSCNMHGARPFVFRVPVGVAGYLESDRSRPPIMR
jgi:hypothetical protein